MGGSWQEWSHWLLLLLVIAGLYGIFAKDTNKTAALFKTGTDTYGNLITDVKAFGS